MKERGVARPPWRMDRLLREHVHDPYKARRKMPKISVCPQCGAVYSDGLWRWGEAPREAHEALCQACHRINDRYPAGFLDLSGNFLRQHEDEVLGLARNQEKAENQEHPLHRIMDIQTRPEGIEILTTDIHLPRRIAEAIHHAYEGDLDYHYEKETYRIRVTWRRDD
jgi:NMD protein affecting ribosome stability and mRNA decay